MQTEAFQGCQAHNSFVCYAIETSCSLLSQYLPPNGMCALLLPLLNNTRLEEGLIASLSFTPCHPLSLFVLASLFSLSPRRLILCFLYSLPFKFCHSLFPRHPSFPFIISLASAPPLEWQREKKKKEKEKKV